MKKRIINMFLVLAMCASVLAGCTVIEEGSTVPKADTITETEADTRIVTDHLGNEVEIPVQLERIAITSIQPLPSVYCMMGEDISKLIGIHPNSMNAAKYSLLGDIYPELLEVPTGFMEGGEVNVEELLAMEPDVVFYNASKEAEGEQLKAAGIPAIAVSTSQWDTPIETFGAWVTLLGEALGKEEKANEIVEYGNEKLAMIQERLAAEGDSLESPRVLYLYSYSNGVFSTSGSTHHGEKWARATGAVNVAGENDTQKFEVSIEQIYEWDPDIIYITNFVPFLPEDLYNNAVEGFDFSVLRAVQDGKVYKCPLGTYRWYPPSSDSPLMLLWMATHNHPELFEDIDMNAEAMDYFKRFYNVDLTDEQLEKLFNPTREAANS